MSKPAGPPTSGSIRAPYHADASGAVPRTRAVEDPMIRPVPIAPI
jgi:hypothetical protein